MQRPLPTTVLLMLWMSVVRSSNADVIVTSHSRLRGSRVRGASSTITRISTQPQLDQYDNISKQRLLKANRRDNLREGEPTGSNRDDPNKRKKGQKRNIKKQEERMKQEKNDPKILFAEVPLTEAPTVAQTAAPTSDPTPAPTPPPSSLPTLPPTNKPTQYPTWTFEVPAPEVVAEAEFVCEYCAGGCFDDTPVVTFGQGSSATCARIREIAPSLNKNHCRMERKIIEETCCCDDSSQIETRITEQRKDEEIVPECKFCEGMEFDETPIIAFSNGNDSVSCGGFMDLVKISGMLADICSTERTIIEEACCKPLQVEEEVEETVSLPSEEIMVEESSVEEMLEFDDIFDNGGNLTEPIALDAPIPESEDEEDEDPADSGLPGRPATIQEGGKRQKKPLGSVDRARRPLTPIAEAVTNSRIDGDNKSDTRKPMYDPNDSRDRDRTTGRVGQASWNDGRDTGSITIAAATLSGTQQESGSSRVNPLYSAEMTRNRGRVAEPDVHRSPVKQGGD